MTETQLSPLGWLTHMSARSGLNALGLISQGMCSKARD